MVFEAPPRYCIPFVRKEGFLLRGMGYFIYVHIEDIVLQDLRVWVTRYAWST